MKAILPIAVLMLVAVAYAVTPYKSPPGVKPWTATYVAPATQPTEANEIRAEIAKIKGITDGVWKVRYHLKPMIDANCGEAVVRDANGMAVMARTANDAEQERRRLAGVEANIAAFATTLQKLLP